MCTPMAVVGLALSAGSTALNSIAAGKAKRARDDALAAERIRQSGFDQEAQALNVQSQDRYVGFDDKQEDRAAELGDFFKGQKIEAQDDNAAATAQSIMPQSGSDITVREEGARRADATAFADRQGEALGNLRAFGDLFGTIGRDQARDASLIGQIGGFKRGSSGVLPLELDAASEAGGGTRMLADLFGLGGQVMTAKGLQGSFAKTPPAGGIYSLYQQKGLY